MGTMVYLSLNDTAIDYGKNRWWTGHAWLFPPGSKNKKGLRASLSEVRFRLDHMGYSLSETRTRFEKSLTRWNRTEELTLSFDTYCEAVASIDFSSITEKDREGFEYDVDQLLLTTLGWDEDRDEGYELEDFLRERLNPHVFLRCLAERPGNLTLPLAWEFEELIENGWETLETLTEIDQDWYVLNHIKLYGWLMDYAGCSGPSELDNWLAQRGLAQSTPYAQQTVNGPKHFMDTLPTVVRNIIHHPENRHQRLDDMMLRDGFEELLGVVHSSVSTGIRPSK